MNNVLLEKFSTAWALATGRPLAFLPEPRTIPEDFPLFFPVIGLVIGLVCSLLAGLVFWLFGALAGSIFSGVLIAVILEIVTGWSGFNGAALFLLRFFPKAEEAEPDRFTAQPMFFGAILFAVRAVMIAAAVQAGGAFWLTAVMLCAYFARAELTAALTPDGVELIRSPRRERMRGAVAGSTLILLFILISRRVWWPAGMFLLTWLTSWYLVRRAENGSLGFNRKTFDTAAYLLETALLILTVIFVHS